MYINNKCIRISIVDIQAPIDEKWKSHFCDSLVTMRPAIIIIIIIDISLILDVAVDEAVVVVGG